MSISLFKKWLRLFFTFSIMGVALLAGTTSSYAAKCGSREIIVKQLTTKFRETLRTRGLISNQLLMEIFASKKGTWSLLFTSPKGQTCVIATGQMWLDNLHINSLPEA